ncbi:MAG TPA: hypothetical protein VFM31_06415, partial [Nitrososphaeraceae archaeon]|nr:hypothetical protein [Nitrososphaeraceae archaeon]
QDIFQNIFSKYESVNNPDLSELILSIPKDFSYASDKILSSFFLSNNNTANGNNYTLNNNINSILKNRIKLKYFINKFHSEAGTINPNIQDIIELLKNPSTEIFVSIHQPNLFPYSGVFKKIVLLEALKNIIQTKISSKKIINLFLIVDHDFMDENWVRVAQIPSVHHTSGIQEIRLPVDNSKRWQLICNMPLFSRTILDKWKKDIKSWIKNSSSSLTSVSDKSLFLNNFEQFWEEVECSHSKAKSYADFNTFLMSLIVNKIWNYETLFVRLSEISSIFEDGFKFLISNYNKYSQALRKNEIIFSDHGIETGISSNSYLNSPLWLHCKCGSKASTKVQRNQQGLSILTGSCMSCKKDLEISLGNNNNNDLNFSNDTIANLSPRAIPILLLLVRELGMNCYASGTAGITYITVGTSVFKELSIDLPLVLVWPSKDIYFGIGQTEALKTINLSNEDDINQYLNLLNQKNFEFENKIKPFLEERERKKNNQEISPQINQNIYNLKEEQRNIRQKIKLTEKVKNAINISPCFIDYAVNFGIKNTERQWYTNLLKNDNLATPIHMTIK